jgi:hypothetical protein
VDGFARRGSSNAIVKSSLSDPETPPPQWKESRTETREINSKSPLKEPDGGSSKHAICGALDMARKNIQLTKRANNKPAIQLIMSTSAECAPA